MKKDETVKLVVRLLKKQPSALINRIPIIRRDLKNIQKLYRARYWARLRKIDLISATGLLLIAGSAAMFGFGLSGALLPLLMGMCLIAARQNIP